MSVFDKAWDIVKAFYIDPDDKDAGWMAEYPYYGLSEKQKEITPEKETSDGKYRVGLNLAHPFYRYKDYHYADGGKTPMTEDEMIQRIIDTIVHEEGHHAIEAPLYSDAHKRFYESDDDYAYFSNFAPSRYKKEAGAMLIEGIPFSEQSKELERRGYMV